MRVGSILALFAVGMFAVQPAFGTGLFNGSVGTKARGLGGAFVGLADDYSAAFWNPAGITQIEGTEMTITAGDFFSLSSMDFSFFAPPPAPEGFLVETRGMTKLHNNFLPGFFLYADPPVLGVLVDKIGLAAYTPTVIESDWHLDDLYELYTDFAVMPEDFLGETAHNTTVYSFGPVLAKQLFPGLTFGVSGNVYYGMQETSFSMPLSGMTSNAPYDTMLPWSSIQYSDDGTGVGYGYGLGLMYQAYENVSVGVSWMSPYKIMFEGDATQSSDANYYVHNLFTEDWDIRDVSEWRYSLIDLGTTDFETEFEWPMWAAAGAAVRLYDDALLLAGGLRWSRWSSTMDEINRVYGADWVDLEFLESAENDTNDTVIREAVTVLLDETIDWDDTIQFSLGLQFKVDDVWTLRGGFSNVPGPAPTPGTNVFFPPYNYNFWVPPSISSYYVSALGITYRHSQNLTVDASFEWYLGTQQEVESLVPAVSAADVELIDLTNLVSSDVIVPTLSLTYSF
jgi:long-chain fatty acid transport protein